MAPCKIYIILLFTVAYSQAIRPFHIKSWPPAPSARVENRIIGGNVAYRHQFPHHVGIILDLAGFCSGSLISTTAVVTVAHCARGASIFDVQLGAQNIEYSNEPDRQVVRSTDVTLHPLWNSDDINNDIAVIILPYAVSGTGIAPVRLPRRSEESETFLGQKATVTGWGMVSDWNYEGSAELKYVNLTVISNSECALNYGTLINESKLCVDTNGGLEGVCGGDSGGPLVIYESDNYPSQIGIVSFGGDGCESGEPAVFTRITSYLDWLESTTGVVIRP